MIEIKLSDDNSDRIFNELGDYNNQFEPKVNYKKVIISAEEDGIFLGGIDGHIAWDLFEISNMVVLKRNQGIGTQLLEKIQEYSKSQGLTKLVTWTLDFQAPDFYKKNGFETIAVVPNYAGEHACHYLMKRI